MANDIRQAMDTISDFNQYLKEIFYDEYPAQLAQDNPEEYNRLLDEYLCNYAHSSAHAVHN